MTLHLPLWRPGEPERLAFWLRHLPRGAWLIAFCDNPATPVQLIEAWLRATTDLTLYSFNLAEDQAKLLSTLPALKAGGRVVISCVGVGQSGESAWPFLDQLWQHWSEYPQLLLLLWLSPAERELLRRRRPAIWSTSSNYFDFLIPAPAGFADSRPWPPIRFRNRADWKYQVRLRQKWLKEQRAAKAASPALLTDLYNQLIRLYYAVGEHRQGEIIAQTHLAEAEQWQERFGQAAALHHLGAARTKQGDYQVGFSYYEQALALWRELNAPAGEALTLGHLGLLHLLRNEWPAAGTLLQQALVLYRQVGDRPGEGATLDRLGEFHRRSGDQTRALALFQRALSIRQEVQDRPGEARTLGNIGAIYQVRGDLERAQELFKQALLIQQELDNRAGEARLRLSLGTLAANQLHQPQQALVHYQRSLHLWQELGYRRNEVIILEQLASVYEQLNDREKALAMYNQAAAIRQELGPES